MNTLPYWCLALKKAECLCMSKTNFAQSIAVFPNQTEVCAATVLTSCSFLGQNRKTEWWIKDTHAKEVKKKKSESGSTWIRTGSPYHYPMPVLHTGHAPHTSGDALMTVRAVQAFSWGLQTSELHQASCTASC